MSLNILAELPVWPSDPVGLAEIALLMAVAAVAYWLLHAVRQAERVWWEQCSRSATSQRAPAQHRIRAAHEDVACRSLPRDQRIVSSEANRAAAVPE